MADQTLSPAQDIVEALDVALRAVRLAKSRQDVIKVLDVALRAVRLAKRREYRARPEVRERERAQENDRRQKPEVKTATVATTKARRDANLEEEREYERLQQARRREDPVIRARMREQNNASYQRRRAVILEKLRLKRIANPEHYQELEKKRDPKKKSAKDKRYRDRNKERLNARSLAKYYRRKATDPLFKLRKILRDRHNAAIRGNAKTGSAIRDLGCSIAELKTYIESLLQDGMTWENYGHDTWHIDHKAPLASFDLTDPEQVKIAFHYTNLQPLWAEDNYKKGARFGGIDQAGFTPS